MKLFLASSKYWDEGQTYIIENCDGADPVGISFKICRAVQKMFMPNFWFLEKIVIFFCVFFKVMAINKDYYDQK